MLFDREQGGFYLLDRLIGPATMTEDGKTMLFVEAGELKEFAFEIPE